MKCLSCNSVFELNQELITCPKCGGLLEIINDQSNFKEFKGRGVWRYKQLIPGEYKKIVTLNEGNTPLINSKKYRNLYF
ncbi:MAG: threonine synthase, partial [Caldisphaera sp.]|nr:threonine synthase [Caldisphaera sp.]